ncbi:MAG: hypothetical protein V1494_05355 [Candidatus Diapherotrites archaeon]
MQELAELLKPSYLKNGVDCFQVNGFTVLKPNTGVNVCRLLM